MNFHWALEKLNKNLKVRKKSWRKGCWIIYGPLFITDETGQKIDDGKKLWVKNELAVNSKDWELFNGKVQAS